MVRAAHVHVVVMLCQSTPHGASSFTPPIPSPSLYLRVAVSHLRYFESLEGLPPPPGVFFVGLISKPRHTSCTFQDILSTRISLEYVREKCGPPHGHTR